MRRSVLRVRRGSAGYLQRCNFQPGVAAGLLRMALDDAGNQEGIDDPPDAGNDQGNRVKQPISVMISWVTAVPVFPR